MLDHYYASIHFPVNYLKAYEKELMPLFEDSFGDHENVDQSGVLRFADDFTEGDSIAQFSSNYAKNGGFEEIEDFCKKAKIPFNRNTPARLLEPSYSIYYRPETGVLVKEHDASFPCHELRSYLESYRNDPADFMKIVESKLNKTYDRQVKSLYSYADDKINKKKTAVR